MRKVYKLAAVTVRPDGGYGIALDGKVLRTPARHEYALPTMALADAIAAEWNAQERDIVPATMPLTTLAATAIDRVPHLRDKTIDEAAAYGATDLLCYRVAEPLELVERQAATWDPLLDWLLRRYDVRLAITDSIHAVTQDSAALARLRAALAATDNFQMAALHALTGATGSLVIALALFEGELDAPAAFAASQIEELFQLERWGSDAEAEKRREGLAVDIAASKRFLDLLRP